MIIADTSVWIDYFAGRPTLQALRLHDELLPSQRVGIGDLILCEVLQGIREENEFERVRQRLLVLQVLSVCDLDIAVQAARNYRYLRAQGITIRRTVDCLIATFCIERGHVLLHNDRDFDGFQEHLGLLVVG